MPEVTEDAAKLLAETELKAQLALTASVAAQEVTAKLDPYHPDIEHIYIAEKAPKLRTSLEVDGVRHSLKFKDGRLVLKGAIAKAFDEDAMSTPAMTSRVKKVNKALGEQLVRQHQSMMSGSAVKGSADTMALSRLKGVVQPGSAKSLGEMAPNNPEALKAFADELAHGDMAITEKVPQVSPLPDNTPAAKTGEPAKTGLNLFTPKSA